MAREPQPYMQNRELSWLTFNERVLEEARDPSNPLAERLKFVSIFTSNLDEFFMIRVGSLYDMAVMGDDQVDSRTGLLPSQQLEAIYRRGSPSDGAAGPGLRPAPDPAPGLWGLRSLPRPARREGQGLSQDLLQDPAAPHPLPSDRGHQPPLPSPPEQERLCGGPPPWEGPQSLRHRPCASLRPRGSLSPRGGTALCAHRTAASG